MIPAAYGLKRLVAQHRANYWKADKLDGFLRAPVYLFPDVDAFDAEEVTKLVSADADLTRTLPHDEVIFEVRDTREYVLNQLAYVRRRDVLVEAVLFIQVRQTRTWGDVLAHAEFPGYGATVEVNPRLVTAAPEAPDEAANALCSVVWRSLAILSQAGIVREQSVSQVHRPKLARAGVRGWTWRQVEIVPDRLVSRSAPQGGTHASPRWHIRRGHWRQLADGRRVFVRECQVGDPDHGGVLKDYTVGERAA